jgi:Sulfotransferase domain
MQRAFDILNIPCYHGAVLLTRPSDVPLWSEALDAKFCDKGKRYGRAEWDKRIGEFGALSDVPVIAFSEDLVEAYPEAKVILVERSLETWEKSFKEGVIEACWHPRTHFIAR